MPNIETVKGEFGAVVRSRDAKAFMDAVDELERSGRYVVAPDRQALFFSEGEFVAFLVDPARAEPGPVDVVPPELVKAVEDLERLNAGRGQAVEARSEAEALRAYV